MDFIVIAVGEAHVGERGGESRTVGVAAAAGAVALRHGGGEREAQGANGPVGQGELRADEAAEERAHPEPRRGGRQPAARAPGRGQGPARDPSRPPDASDGGGRRPGGKRSR